MPLSLNDRERYVLIALSKGDSHKEIAERLQVRPCTVSTYVSRARMKMGCRTAIEAVARLVRSEPTIITHKIK